MSLISSAGRLCSKILRTKCTRLVASSIWVHSDETEPTAIEDCYNKQSIGSEEKKFKDGEKCPNPVDKKTNILIGFVNLKWGEDFKNMLISWKELLGQSKKMETTTEE